MPKKFLVIYLAQNQKLQLTNKNKSDKLNYSIILNFTFILGFNLKTMKNVKRIIICIKFLVDGTFGLDIWIAHFLTVDHSRTRKNLSFVKCVGDIYSCRTVRLKCNTNL